MIEIKEIDKILIKMHYKAKKQALKELIKEHKNDKKMIKKLKIMLAKEPANV